MGRSKTLLGRIVQEIIIIISRRMTNRSTIRTREEEWKRMVDENPDMKELVDYHRDEVKNEKA